MQLLVEGGPPTRVKIYRDLCEVSRIRQGPTLLTKRGLRSSEIVTRNRAVIEMAACAEVPEEGLNKLTGASRPAHCCLYRLPNSDFFVRCMRQFVIGCGVAEA